LLFGLIEALLLIRFVLKALAANAEAGFAQLIYAVTGPLVAPFTGLFGTPQAATGAVLELHTLIAMLIYALVAWLVVRGAGLILGEGRSASVARTDSVQTRAR
jgi:YggT family protein